MSEDATQTTDETAEVVEAETTTTTTDDSKPTGRDKAIAEERRKARAAEKRAQELETRLAERDRKEAEAEGRWQEIAEQEREKAATLERQIAERDQRAAVSEAARRLRFRNPDVAYRLLDETDRADPEAALKRLAKQEQYLIEDAPARTGAGVTGTAPNEDPLAQAGRGVLDVIERQRGRA